MASLLIVHHTPSPNVRELLEAACEGVRLPELAHVQVRVEPALSATASDLLAADAVLLITPANIGYMSGALKHFFDTVYYPCLDATRRLPWGLIVHGNNDTAGAARSVVRITQAMQWAQAGPILEVVGAVSAHDRSQAQDLAAVLALQAVERAGR